MLDPWEMPKLAITVYQAAYQNPLYAPTQMQVGLRHFDLVLNQCLSRIFQFHWKETRAWMPV